MPSDSRTSGVSRSPRKRVASTAIRSGAEQMARSAAGATPTRVTARKKQTWYAAMARPSAQQSGRSAREGQGRSDGWRAAKRPTPAAASTSTGAAIARRRQPTRSGEAADRRGGRGEGGGGGPP